MTDVPVCAGRGSQPRCKHYKANGQDPAVRWCMALYDVVTGHPMQVDCRTVRGDQALCGRHGVMYEAVEQGLPHVEARRNAQTRGGDVMGVEGALSKVATKREDLG